MTRNIIPGPAAIFNEVGSARAGRPDRPLDAPLPGTRHRSLAAAILAAILVLGPDLGAGQAGAAEIVGRPRVLDGDTLDFAGRRVHLWGVDAPEREQACRAAAGAWPCGKEARWALLNRVSPHWVTCVEKGLAADGAVWALCYLAGVGQLEVNAWLVAEGWALADRRVSDAYTAEEAAAQAAGKGLWRGAFDAPWDWRRDEGLEP